MTDWIWVAAGGAVGSTLRYFSATWVQRQSGAEFPLGTLAVNVAGCALLGFIQHVAIHSEAISPTARAGLTVGFLGGLTTYSTFGFETFKLIESGALATATLNVGAQLACGITAVWLGTVAARALLNG
ncbi:MAG: fluoride efflux transporter CrcB [Myxococcales bacterium]|nr:fluoride efflux transporter CrcB [Myxococcales bacterium]